MGESSEISWDAWEPLRHTCWELDIMHTCKLEGIICDIGTLIIMSRMSVLIYVCVFVHLSQQILYFCRCGSSVLSTMATLSRSYFDEGNVAFACIPCGHLCVCNSCAADDDIAACLSASVLA